MVREATNKLTNELRDEILRPRGIASAEGKESGRSYRQSPRGRKTRGKMNILNKEFGFLGSANFIFFR